MFRRIDMHIKTCFILYYWCLAGDFTSAYLFMRYTFPVFLYPVSCPLLVYPFNVIKGKVASCPWKAGKNHMFFLAK